MCSAKRMSALGQKRTFAVQNAMSALPPKADMCGALANVRLVPEANFTVAVNFGQIPDQIGIEQRMALTN